jgi:hypothetical protein
MEVWLQGGVMGRHGLVHYFMEVWLQGGVHGARIGARITERAMSEGG